MTAPRTGTAAVALAAALLALGGCGSATNTTRQPQPGTTSVKAPPAPKPADSVVFVRARYGNRTTFGTGFIYDARKGLILTSDHAIEASPAVTVTTRDGRVLHGHAMARAQCHDFAVVALHPIPIDLVALSFAESSTVAAGQRLTSVAFSKAAQGQPPQVQITNGRVMDVEHTAVLHPLLPAFRHLIAHNASLSSTASGSPLLNGVGQVIGLNTLVGYHHGAGAHHGEEYAVSSDEIYRLLRQLDEGPEDTLAGWRPEHRCHRAMDTIAGVPLQRTMHMHEGDHMP